MQQKSNTFTEKFDIVLGFPTVLPLELIHVSIYYYGVLAIFKSTMYL